MEEPSPFNNVRPELEERVQAVRSAHFFVVQLNESQTPIYQEDPCFEQCHIYCNRTLDLILNLGIPAKLGYSLWEMENDTEDDEKRKILELPLRWAAARGPLSEQNETKMCETRLKPCLQCVYNSLLGLLTMGILENPNIVRHNELL